MNKTIFEEENGRDIIIDTAKGMTILLVVIGHRNYLPSFLTTWIYAFHMPLFFLLSGYFAKKTAIWPYVLKQAKKLLLPYVACYVTFNIIISLLSKEHYTFFYYLNDLLRCGYKTDLVTRELWFLTSLFVIRIIYSLLMMLPETWIRSVIVVCLTVLGIILSLNAICLPLRAETSFVGILFYHLGHLCRHFHILPRLKKMRWYVAVFVALIPVGLLGWTVSFNGRTDMASLTYQNAFLFFINALLGIAAVLLMASVIQCDIFPFLGKNTMSIYLYHIFPVVALKYVWQKIGLSGGFLKVVNLVLCWAVMFGLMLIREIVLKSKKSDQNG